MYLQNNLFCQLYFPRKKTKKTPKRPQVDTHKNNHKNPNKRKEKKRIKTTMKTVDTVHWFRKLPSTCEMTKLLKRKEKKKRKTKALSNSFDC